MNAFVIYGILRDNSIERGKNKLGALPENFEEKDVLKAIDDYFQGLVRDYRERKRKERNECVEKKASAILLSMMGYEVEGGAKPEDLDEVADALRYLLSYEEIRTIIAESNERIVESLYRKKKEMRKMGE